MPIAPHDIKDAIDEFFSCIEAEGVEPDERIRRLQRALDRLAFLQHDISVHFDDRDYPDPPDVDSDALRRLISRGFPELGYYNIPDCVTQDIAATEILVGDAIDDVADIARELADIRWRWEHTSVDDALWNFQNMYFLHWEAHLRQLQLFLQRLRRGDEDREDGLTNRSSQPLTGE
jgi:hypothetical protein